MSQTILEEIRDYKLEEISQAKAQTPLRVLEDQARSHRPARGFAKALTEASDHGYGLIAEIKKASPSKGLIREDFDPASLAAAYEAGGATCLSVLTDGPSFQGAPDHLKAARGAVNLPVLRKDFMFDTYQVAEARAWGADAILIIMAAVDDRKAQELEDAAQYYGLDVLIEVHDAQELDRAQKLHSSLIGINNRDLHSFATSLRTTEDLAPKVSPGRLVVSESGISTPADLHRLAASGARCFLVGESLMRHADIKDATQALLAPFEGAAE